MGQCGGRRVSPREETLRNQRAAADPAASAFVTANAGSGKTKVLVDRIARLLLTGAPPSAFLCITYTKAAAAEMQRRLLQRLGAWCVCNDTDLTEALRDLLGAAVTPARDDLARARGLFAQALETPGGLRIQTIHAFCERLLARFPIEAQVAPGFQIVDDALSAQLMQAAWTDVAQSGDAEIEAAFARFARALHSERLSDLFDALVQQRAKFAAFSDRHGGDAAAAHLRARHGAEGARADVIAAFLAQTPWDDVRRAAQALSGSSTNDAKLAASLFDVLGREFNTPDARFLAYCAAYLTGKGDAPKNAVTVKFAKAQPWVDGLVRDEISRILAATARVRAIDRAEDAIALTALSRALNARYERRKDAAGALDFEDLIARARALLADADAAPWVLYKLDGGIDHILIDEGQDTSPAQWDVVAPLQAEFFAGRGARDTARTVFAVGDPKQSIYGFQGADPQRFLSESQQLSARAAAAQETFVAPVLRASFRSAPEILRAVDETMSALRLGEGPFGEDVVEHLADRAACQGLVEWWPLAPRPETGEAQPWDAPLDMERQDDAVARLCKELASTLRDWIARGEGVWEYSEGAWRLRPMRAGDILILVRKRGKLFSQMLKALKRAGLPVAGADRMALREELAAQDCAALLRVALDTSDDLSVATVLKGPWLNLIDDDAALFPLAFGRAPGETLFDRVLESEDPQFAEAKMFLSALAERSGDAPFDFLSWALEIVDANGRSGWARIFARLGPEARDPIEELLARALSAESRGAGALQSFLAEFERDESQLKREMDEAGEAVRVMTAHGAKGLEAPVVVLPDTAGGVNARFDGGFMFAPDGPVFSPKTEADDEAAGAERERQKALAAYEHARLLYVAMTRARDRLIVCGAAQGNLKDGAASESWHASIGAAMARIGAACETPFGQGLRIGAALRADAAAPARQARFALPAWLATAAPNARSLRVAAPSYAHRATDAALSPLADADKPYRRGRLIHGLLQRLPDLAPERRADAALQWLARQGVSSDDAALLSKESLAILQTPAFAAAFGPASRAEVPVVGVVHGVRVSGVVDRLSIASKHIEIIDFKTDRPPPQSAEDAPDAYVLQLALYRAALQQAFPGAAVACALIWTHTAQLMALPPETMEAALSGFGAA
ncbi:MAG: double-strand break repair helicase AddA [Alphaproteobacteria bacterium]|nr:double-strand break repair helicase AddA [Alphaproteobacteria bacterium]